MRGQAPLLVVAGLGAIGVGVGVVQAKVIPEGPVALVAILLILGGLTALGHVVVKIVKVSRGGNGERTGTRRSDDHQIDRAQIREEITTFSLVAQTHERVEALWNERSDVKALLEKMTDMLAHGQETAAIQAGTMEQLIRNQMQIEVALVKQGERLEHVPTKAEFMAEHEHTRHALRNDGTILAGGGKLPSVIR